MNLKELKPRKGDLVLIIRGEDSDPTLYQFEAMKDGYAFARRGFELKKPVRIGRIEIPQFMPLHKQYSYLIPIPLVASKIYCGFGDVISGLMGYKGYEIYAEIMNISTDRPIRKPIH